MISVKIHFVLEYLISRIIKINISNNILNSKEVSQFKINRDNYTSLNIIYYIIVKHSHRELDLLFKYCTMNYKIIFI